MMHQTGIIKIAAQFDSAIEFYLLQTDPCCYGDQAFFHGKRMSQTFGTITFLVMVT